MAPSSISRRSIVHMDLDAFFVSCEVLHSPELAGQPVIIGSLTGRGVVAACSYAARQFGVHSAMPMRTARKRCPRGIYLRPNGARYRHYAQRVRELAHAHLPVVEFASIDEFYGDLTGTERFFGAEHLAGQLREAIRQELGLPISMGLASSKCVAKIATGEAKPDGWRVVPAGTEAAFLAPLPLSVMPSLGPKTRVRLEGLGLQTLGDLQQLSADWLAQEFGRHGIGLWKRAHGRDDSLIRPDRVRKSLGVERTFGNDCRSAAELRRILIYLVEEIAYGLRKEDLLCEALTLKLRDPAFETHTYQRRFPRTNQEEELLRVARGLLSDHHCEGQAIRLMGLRAGQLTRGGVQGELFDDQAAQGRLAAARDALRGKYGGHPVRRAAGLKS